MGLKLLDDLGIFGKKKEAADPAAESAASGGLNLKDDLGILTVNSPEGSPESLPDNSLGLRDDLGIFGPKPTPDIVNPKPKSFTDHLKQLFAPSAESQIAKAQNIYAISQKTGKPLQAVAANYEREAARYLRPPESFAPEDRVRMALDQGFARGLIATEPLYPEFQEEHPVLDAIGQGSGALAGLVATGSALKGVGVGSTVYKAIFAKYGIKSIPIATGLSRMLETGVVFGTKSAGEKVVQLLNRERLTAQSAKDVLEDTAFGLGLGAVGSLPKPAVRIPAEMMYGYVTAKIQGADNLNAMINAGVFGIFSVLNRADYSKEYKISAMNEIVENMGKKAESFGLPLDVAKQQAERFVHGNLMSTTGEMEPAKAWEKILSSKEYNLAYFDRLNENLKTLRRLAPGMSQQPQGGVSAPPGSPAITPGAPDPGATRMPAGPVPPMPAIKPGSQASPEIPPIVKVALENFPPATKNEMLGYLSDNRDDPHLYQNFRKEFGLTDQEARDVMSEHKDMIETTVVDQAAIEKVIAAAGGKLRGISDMQNTIYRDKEFNPLEPTVYFDDPQGSTKTLPLSQVTPESVKAKVGEVTLSKMLKDQTEADKAAPAKQEPLRAKHFTNKEGKAALERGEKFDFTKKPIHGTGSLGEMGADRSGRFAGNRIYLSLDDQLWGKSSHREGEDKVVDVTLENMKDLEVAAAETIYDYEKQKWVAKVGAKVVVDNLESVEYEIDPGAKIKVIDSMEALKAAQKEVGQAALHNEENFFNALEKKYDAVVFKNVRKIAQDTDSKFFKAILSDQIIVLNTDKARVVKPAAGKSLTPKVNKTAVEQKTKKKAQIIKQVIELLPGESEMAGKMRGEIDAGTAGYRYVTTDEYTGDVAHAGSEPSTFPEYFKNKGYTKKDTLAIIDKVTAGKPVTEKQKAVFDDLLNGYKQSLQEEIRNAEHQRKLLSLEDSLKKENLSQSDIEESLRSAEEDFTEEENLAGIGVGQNLIRLFDTLEQAQPFIDRLNKNNFSVKISPAEDNSYIMIEAEKLPPQKQPSEKVPGGEQLVVPGTEGRSMPSGPMQPAAPQAEEKLTQLKYGLPQEKQQKIFDKGKTYSVQQIREFRSMTTDGLEKYIDGRYESGAPQRELNILEEIYSERVSEEEADYSEETHEGARLEDNLVQMYYRYLHPESRHGMEIADILSNMRESVLTYGGRTNVTDEQLLAAAKDIFERRAALILKYKSGKKYFLDLPAMKSYTVSEGESEYYAISETERKDIPESSTGISQSPLKVKFKKQGVLLFAKQQISSPADVAFAFQQLKNEAVERFYVVGVKDSVPVSVEPISIGSINASIVDPKEPLLLLLNNKATEFYCVHNHPSGDVDPSEDDLNITDRLKKAYLKFNIKFAGHVIIDDTKFGFIDKFGMVLTFPHHSAGSPDSPKKVPVYTKYIEWISKPPDTAGIVGPDDLFDIVKGFTQDREKNALVFYLNTRNVVMASEAVPNGKINSNYLIQQALAARSPQVIIYSNGLNNDEIKQLHKALELIAIDLLDCVRDVKPTDLKLRNIKDEFVSARSSGVIGEKKTPYRSETDALNAGTWGVTMPKEAEIPETVNKTEILTWVEKAFKVPIRGKATTRFRNLAGTYHNKQELIRLRFWGELEPMIHELAHHIDKLMMQALGMKWKTDNVPAAARQAVINELRALDYDQGKKRIKEGFAEFMRYYLTMGDTAAFQKAPEFFNFFVNTFLPQHKDLATNLAELRKRLTIWQKQGAENRIIEQIDFKGEHTNVVTAGNKLRKARDWILKNFSDEFYTIKKIEDQMGIKPGVNIEPAKDPFTMATYAKAKASAIARTFVLEKAVDETGKVLGPGLKEILDPIKPEEMKQFIAYGVAMRSAFLAERGIESGIDIDDVKFILEKYENKGWDPVIDGITKWSDHFLGWLIRSGGLGPAEAEAIRALNPIYLPFKRAFLNDLEVQKGIGKAMVNKGSPIKSIKGSGRAIINPIESLVAQATEMILKAQKINVARLIADLAEKEGVGGFIARVPPPIQGTTFSLEQIKSSLEAMGIDLAAADLDSVLTVFTQGWQYRGKDNIVSIWRSGKREFYELHPDLYRALMGMDMLERGVLLKILSPFARLLRLGATGIKISFGLIRNPWRDALSYAVLSKNKLAIPGVDTIKGVARELTAKPGDLAWRFKAVGGSLSGMMGYDRAATMSVYDDMVNAKLKALNKVIKAVEPQNWFKTVAYMLDQLRGGLNITELGPRIAELESSYNRYRKENPGWTEESCFIAAFNDAQDVTVNFTKSGFLGKRINEVIAFFNANIQGPEKMIRSAKSNPVAFLLKGIIWLTVPIILNWMRNNDKEWYNNLPPEYRYGNIFIEIDDNNILRLPIPFEVGAVFLAAPAAALDYLKKKDPKYIQSVTGIISKQFPSIWPSALQPIKEVWQNRTAFDNPIETKEMEYMPRQERKKYYTSTMAVELSKALKGLGLDVLSPVQIDYLTQQYTGGFTRQFPHGNILTAADAPVLSDILVKAPYKPARQMNEFYTDWETLTYKYRTKTLEKGELTQYQRLKVVSKYMEIYFDALKKYNQKKDLEGIKKTYRRIEDALAKVGY